MKRALSFAATVLFALVLAVSAHAFDLGDHVGKVKLKFSNWENVDPNPEIGSGPTHEGIYMGDNYGILKITTIEDLDGNQLWSELASGEQITGIWYGVDVWRVIPGTPIAVDSISGRADLYIQSKGDAGYTAFNPDPDGDGNPMNNFCTANGKLQFPTVTDGTPFLSVVAGPGVLDDKTTFHGTFDQLSKPFSGDAEVYLDVIPGSGAYASSFDSDGFSVDWYDDAGNLQTADRDLWLRNHFDVQEPLYGWDNRSEDPVEAFIIPCIDIEKEVLDSNGLWQDADTEAEAVGLTDGAQYRLIVKNCGISALHNVTITDPVLGIDVNIGDLAPGEEKTFTKDNPGFENLDQPDRCVPPDTYENIATVIGFADDIEITDSDPAWVICEQVGDEGCTPGYWKNHLEAWVPTGYSPVHDFDTIFEVDLFDPNITLGEAINAKGGGVNKLARHGTAALLGAAHPDVDYPLTVAEVKAAVQAGDADMLVEYNELGCPID